MPIHVVDDLKLVNGGSRGKDGGIPKVIRIHPLVAMNICTKCHGNQPDNWHHISLQNKMSTCWWRYRESQGTTRIRKIQALGTMDVCTKFHGNPSKSCQFISVWTEVVERPADILTLSSSRATLLTGLKTQRYSIYSYILQGKAADLTHVTCFYQLDISWLILWELPINLNLS